MKTIRFTVAFPSELFAAANSVPLLTGSVTPFSALAALAFKNPLLSTTGVPMFTAFVNIRP